jgi:predicted small metal-binding protein
MTWEVGRARECPFKCGFVTQARRSKDRHAGIYHHLKRVHGGMRPGDVGRQDVPPR